jgi:hypothetical protein
MEDVGIPVGLFYGHLLKFMVLWYIFSSFSILHQEISGNPATTARPGGKKNFRERSLGKQVVTVGSIKSRPNDNFEHSFRN